MRLSGEREVKSNQTEVSTERLSREREIMRSRGIHSTFEVSQLGHSPSFVFSLLPINFITFLSQLSPDHRRRTRTGFSPTIQTMLESFDFEFSSTTSSSLNLSIFVFQCNQLSSKNFVNESSSIASISSTRSRTTECSRKRS